MRGREIRVWKLWHAMRTCMLSELSFSLALTLGGWNALLIFMKTHSGYVFNINSITLGTHNRAKFTTTLNIFFFFFRKKRGTWNFDDELTQLFLDHEAYIFEYFSLFQWPVVSFCAHKKFYIFIDDELYDLLWIYRRLSNLRINVCMLNISWFCRLSRLS